MAASGGWPMPPCSKHNSKATVTQPSACTGCPAECSPPPGTKGDTQGTCASPPLCPQHQSGPHGCVTGSQSAPGCHCCQPPSLTARSPPPPPPPCSCPFSAEQTCYSTMSPTTRRHPTPPHITIALPHATKCTAAQRAIVQPQRQPGQPLQGECALQTPPGRR